MLGVPLSMSCLKKMSRYFIIRFSDLHPDKQEEIVQAITSEMEVANHFEFGMDDVRTYVEEQALRVCQRSWCEWEIDGGPTPEEITRDHVLTDVTTSDTVS